MKRWESEFPINHRAATRNLVISSWTFHSQLILTCAEFWWVNIDDDKLNSLAKCTAFLRQKSADCSSFPRRSAYSTRYLQTIFVTKIIFKSKRCWILNYRHLDDAFKITVFAARHLIFVCFNDLKIYHQIRLRRCSCLASSKHCHRC